MNLLWQRFTLSNLPFREYLSTSYLHRGLVGSLSAWRQTSLLLRWGEAIACALLSLVYGLAPFVSTEIIGLLLVACIGFWLLLTISDTPTNINSPTITPIHLIIFLYWGVAVAAAALSPVKKAALGDLRNFTLYILLFVVCARVLKTPRFRSFLIALYLHVSLFVSIYGVRQKFFGAAQLATWVDPESPLAKNTRVYSYLGNPNLLAGYLLPAIVLSLIAIFAWQRLALKFLALTMLIVNLACFRFADSRGAFIGIAVAAVVLIVGLRYWYSRYLPPFWRTWLIPMFFAGLIGAFAIGYEMSDVFKLRINSMFAGSKDSSNNFRIQVWNAVFKMIRDRPILGIGPGHASFNSMYPFYQIRRFTALSSYSVFLEHIVEMGFIGLSAFLWLLTIIFNTAIIQLRRFRAENTVDGLWIIGAIASLVAMLGHGLVDTVWYRPAINTLWWFMAAIIASYWIPKSPVEAVTDSPNRH
ncbi:IctB family putative bicarbonate transporter [Calothrix sp. PCC 6303]|uniref:IctB family putative bicarbonate transporter n=1 Tax=Calothrix sp. PCC 6303 TaxID=1170562 RepID=UPI0002A001F1|nr:IctB family putative bicarbonate transporter [Calothrix sp. PCC 6303]AFZ03720.1 inorganic carbon transporter [Calothrix sp. PCC 6303]